MRNGIHSMYDNFSGFYIYFFIDQPSTNDISLLHTKIRKTGAKKKSKLMMGLRRGQYHKPSPISCHSHNGPKNVCPRPIYGQLGFHKTGARVLPVCIKVAAITIPVSLATVSHSFGCAIAGAARRRCRRRPQNGAR